GHDVPSLFTKALSGCGTGRGKPSSPSATRTRPGSDGGWSLCRPGHLSTRFDRRGRKRRCGESINRWSNRSSERFFPIDRRDLGFESGVSLATRRKDGNVFLAPAPSRLQVCPLRNPCRFTIVEINPSREQHNPPEPKPRTPGAFIWERPGGRKFGAPIK